MIWVIQQMHIYCLFNCSKLHFHKCFLFSDECILCLFSLGDPAIGDGVTRHFFATIMGKIQRGFEFSRFFLLY